MNYESDAISGYCCSGVNHFRGEGPNNNGDCPTQAVEIQKSKVHSCVVSKKIYQVPSIESTTVSNPITQTLTVNVTETSDGKIYEFYCFYHFYVCFIVFNV